jgi:3-oxoacyl-[acyl-carrier-protein] synthase II
VTHRVVVTGMGVASPIGHDPIHMHEALIEGRSGVVCKPQWGRYRGIVTRLAGEVQGLTLSWPRKRVRTMGRVAKLALHATEQAIAQTGLQPGELGSGRTGLAYGSTHGSTEAMEAALRRVFVEDTLEGMPSSAYLKFMSHTVAANLAIALGIRGRVLPTCSACTSGSQAIGTGYETLRHGLADVMICGGAEELHEIHAAVFDVMFATSTQYNDAPDRSPRPFDADRDGLVVGEGAGTLVLETWEHAQARGAPALAEVVGYGTNCDGMHATSPSIDGMADAMRLALADARLDPAVVGYINAHATATELGDIAESQATARVMGSNTPISSTKGVMGHTLGACGAIESIVCVLAMQHGVLPPTRNLEHPDERCAPLRHVRGPTNARPRVVMNNNFAFGGINTSLLFASP